MTSRGIGGWPKPVSTRVHPGSPHTGAIDLGFAQATEALWSSGCRSAYTWCWEDPAIAPTAIVVALDTDYPFSYLDGSEDPVASLGYRAQDGAIGIQVVTEVAFRAVAAGVFVWPSVDSGAGADGGKIKIPSDDPSKVSKSFGNWRRGKDGDRWSTSTISTYVDCASLIASDQNLELSLTARLEVESAAHPATTGFSETIKLSSVTVFDIMGSP